MSVAAPRLALIAIPVPPYVEPRPRPRSAGIPAGYRHSWSGASYLGGLLVHAGPGVLTTAPALSYWRRKEIRGKVLVVLFGSP